MANKNKFSQGGKVQGVHFNKDQAGKVKLRSAPKGTKGLYNWLN